MESAQPSAQIKPWMDKQYVPVKITVDVVVQVCTYYIVVCVDKPVVDGKIHICKYYNGGLFYHL